MTRTLPVAVTLVGLLQGLAVGCDSDNLGPSPDGDTAYDAARSDSSHAADSAARDSRAADTAADSGACEPGCEEKVCGQPDGCGGVCRPGSGCREVDAPDSAEFLGRSLVALPKNDGVYLSWRFLPRDSSRTAFHVYRETGGGTLSRITSSPVENRTNYFDSGASKGTTYRYRVKPFDDSGDEGRASNLAEATAGSTSHLLSTPLQPRNDGAKVYGVQRIAPGDVNGDGVLDFVLISHGGDRTSAPYNLELIRSEPGGWSSAWRVSTGYRKQGRNMAVVVTSVVLWDLTGDGRAEIVTRWGANGDDLAVLDPSDGSPLDRERIPRGSSAYHRFVGVAPGYLEDLDGDGFVDPFIVTQSAMGEPKFAAFSYDEEQGLTVERNVGFTVHDGSDGRPGFELMGTHGLPVADIDGDGRDEVLPCGSVLHDDWSSYRVIYHHHSDVCYPADIDPARPGPELFVGGNINAILTELSPKSGLNRLWRETSTYQGSYEGWDKGWAADIDSMSKGLEIILLEESEGMDHSTPVDNKLFTRVFTASGNNISSQFGFQMHKSGPIDWSSGDGSKAIWHDCAGSAQPGSTECVRGQTGDVVGDSREELFWVDVDSNTFRIATNVDAHADRHITPLADRNYRAFVGRMGAQGYGSNWIPARSGQKRHDLIPSPIGSCEGKKRGEVCRPSRGPCDAPEVCGADGCPNDDVLPKGTVCRESTDSCDPAEVCDGATTDCPVDTNNCTTCTPGSCTSDNGNRRAAAGKVFVDADCEQRAPTARVHCGASTDCEAGDCTGTIYYRACDGSGSCRSGNAGAHAETVKAKSCKVLDENCKNVSPGVGFYCDTQGSPPPGNNCECVTHFRGCRADGSCRTDNTCATKHTSTAPSGKKFTSDCHLVSGNCP